MLKILNNTELYILEVDPTLPFILSSSSIFLRTYLLYSSKRVIYYLLYFPSAWLFFYSLLLLCYCTTLHSGSLNAGSHPLTFISVLFIGFHCPGSCLCPAPTAVIPFFFIIFHLLYILIILKSTFQILHVKILVKYIMFYTELLKISKTQWNIHAYLNY